MVMALVSGWVVNSTTGTKFSFLTHGQCFSEAVLESFSATLWLGSLSECLVSVYSIFLSTASSGSRQVLTQRRTGPWVFSTSNLSDFAVTR